MTSVPHHSRREFLQGKAAARIIADAVPPVSNEPCSTDRMTSGVGRSGYLVSIERRAMACEFELQFPADRQEETTKHALQALELIDTLEAQMTVYRDDSELMRINRTAAQGPVPVEPRLYEVLKLAERLYHETAGALDITSGPLSRIWGFTRREGRVPRGEEIQSALEIVGFDKVQLDDASKSVYFRRKGVELNLNSLGKGYALDRAAEALFEAGVSDYLLHGGKSSVLARGANPAGNDGSWSIGLRDPLHPERRLAGLFLRDEAISTSGSATQFFQHAGRFYGHILDPRNGRPAEGIYTATVVARTALLAEALSTAFYVMGLEATEAYCAVHPEIRAALIVPTDQVGGLRLVTFGMATGEWQPLG